MGLMKQKFIDYFMDVADRTSQLSHAIRLQVGAIIVKDDRIISIGYNGMPSGWDNNCEEKVYKIDGWLVDDEGSYELKTKPEVLHAEMNCLMKTAKSTDNSNGAVMFCTHAPCIDCAKAIFQAGINSVFYRTQYRSDDGINFLNKSGVNVTRHTVQD